MESLVADIKNNIKRVRLENGYGIMMDINEKFYFINPESYDLLSYILENEYSDIVNYFEMKHNDQKKEEHKLAYFAEKILSYLSNEENEFDGQRSTNVKEQLKNVSMNIKLRAPIYISLQLLDICNLRCRHCYNDSHINNETIVPFNKVKGIIDQLDEAGVFMIGLTGGEILLHPELFKIIEYAHNKRMLINMNSNGMLLTKENALKLKKSGLNSLKISIDGCRENHNYIRQNPKSFDRAVEAVKISRDSGLKPEIFFVAMKKNLYDIEYMINLARELDVDINVRRFIPMGRGEQEIGNILDYKDVKFLLSTVEKCNYKRVTIDKCYISDARRSNCIICNKTVGTITKDGNVFTCPYIQHEELKLGNIREKSFQEIYKSVNNHPFVDIDNSKFNEPCRSCESFYQCYGGCRGTAYVLNNKEVHALDPQCGKVDDYLNMSV